MNSPFPLIPLEYLVHFHTEETGDQKSKAKAYSGFPVSICNGLRPKTERDGGWIMHF
jgi:hypothetical protein